MQIEPPVTLPPPDPGFDQRLAGARPALERYVRRRVPAADVDDVVNDVALVAWRRRDELGGRELLPWLYGVAANVVRNRSRSERRRFRLRERLVGLRAAHVPDAADQLTADDGRVLGALARLSADDQELLRLVAWEQLPYADIAELLGCTPNAVALRARRARNRFAAELAAVGILPPTTPTGGRHV